MNNIDKHNSIETNGILLWETAEDNNPVIEDVGFSVEDLLEKYEKQEKEKRIKGSYPRWCVECKKEFHISKTQLFCPRCGVPLDLGVSNEEDDDDYFRR